jgi:SAM-dependent methyltransferase
LTLQREWAREGTVPEEGSKMRGFVDQVSSKIISGWVFDPQATSHRMQVRVTLGDKVLVEGVADQPRPDVGKMLGTGGAHGFRFSALDLSAKDVGRVAILAKSEATDTWRPVRRGGRRSAVQYQTFDDAKGGSKSAEKLKALALGQLKNRHSEASPLRDRSVLDIGCNEGFFCGAALQQGAARVVGIDMNKGFLERARKRFPEAVFRHGSWWDLPDEKFDVIFFLSAIHYEPRQRALLEKLAGHLTPTGTLVLECGAIAGLHTKSWQTVRRADGVRRYPTFPMLRLELLRRYAPRFMGESVMQSGDPIRRYVFHCQLREPMALLVSGHSDVGKSLLAGDLEERNIPVLQTDKLLSNLLKEPRYDWSPVVRIVRRKPFTNLAAIGRTVAVECPREFVDLILLEGPTEADLFCIEGEILRHDSIMKELVRRLREQGIKPWFVTAEPR